ncbi:sodium/glutamate symporter [Albimonas sp. CAU 1670]|uniref:sodium/glutamate symporter n=1 Tax=Albimonas sp. CAU 1670 TaxID=3032599 RepID=UPI0023DA20B0|nr:sodium/glutamate symporter [Albimonas sp. CAU 1670]MDF2234952.1 sodium/glutamate symporter [Albimonas sp. CAU 1670]
MAPDLVLHVHRAPDHLALTMGLVTWLVGADLTRRVRLLRDWNIPEAVTGGLLASLVLLAAREGLGTEIAFEMETRDSLMVLFFAGIGLNARLADLVEGGRPLAILLALTVAYIALQDVLGVAVALAFGAPAGMGVLMGSAALIGGHGTAIAWAPEVAEATGAAGAAELGVAMATLGLVAAALVGGPVARFLIEGRNLMPSRPAEDLAVGVSYDEEVFERITLRGLMRALLALNVSVALGYVAAEAIEAAGFKLPLFVPCLLMGIVVGNLWSALAPSDAQVSRTPALNVISDFSLSVFLAMSLMSLQLWTLAEMGWMMLAALLVQVAAAVAFILWAVFPAMGSAYRAAVLSAGFAGFSLGATPTAIANMTAVAKRYGPSPTAFVILPLVSAFFVDLANAAAIRLFLSL